MVSAALVLILLQWLMQSNLHLTPWEFHSFVLLRGSDNLSRPPNTLHNFFSLIIAPDIICVSTFSLTITPVSYVLSRWAHLEFLWVLENLEIILVLVWVWEVVVQSRVSNFGANFVSAGSCSYLHWLVSTLLKVAFLNQQSWVLRSFIYPELIWFTFPCFTFVWWEIFSNELCRYNLVGRREVCVFF